MIGTRRKDRSITDSSVAIDVISPEQIDSTGYSDVNDALRTLVPAFNAQRLQGNDGSSFVRPITTGHRNAFHEPMNVIVAIAAVNPLALGATTRQNVPK